MNSNSINVYFTELKNLNKNREILFKCIGEHPNTSVEQLMKVLNIKERNIVAPRVSDLLNLNLIFVSGSIRNKRNHKTNIFKIVNSFDFIKPKIDNNLRLILDKLSKLNQDDLRSLSHTVEGMIKYDV